MHVQAASSRKRFLYRLRIADFVAEGLARTTQIYKPVYRPNDSKMGLLTQRKYAYDLVRVSIFVRIKSTQSLSKRRQ